MHIVIYNKLIIDGGESLNIQSILKNRRIELGLTMLDVANKVGVSEGTISRWESGNIANMRRDKIVSLAKALDLSPAVIMGWDQEDTNPPEDTDSLNTQRQFPPSSDIESDDLKKLYSLIGNLPPEYLDEAERYLTFLVESQKKKEQL